MRTFARIEGDTVAELLESGTDVTGRFHPALRWMEVTGREVAVGWRIDGAGFAPPAPPAPVPPPPSLAALEAQVRALAAQVAALAGGQG